MNEKRFTPSHPIVFIFDPANRSMLVPEIDVARVACANPSYVSVKNLADVDGEVSVAFGPHPDPLDGFVVFEGAVDSPSLELATTSAENEKLVSVSVPSKRTSINVFVDDLQFPSRVVVQLR
jgi:hypothetical protein